MKKACSKAIALLLAVLMLAFALPFAAFAQEEGATVNGVSAKIGETVTVSWVLEAPCYIVNAELNVSYPSEILSLVSTENSVCFPVLSKAGLETNYLDGEVYAVATNASVLDSDLYDFTSGAVLCSLQFEVVASGDAEVALNAEYIGGKNPLGISEDEIDCVVQNTASQGVSLTQSTAVEEPDCLTINGDVTANIGQYVIYDVKIESSALIVDMQGLLNYDPEYLQLENVLFPVITNMVSNTAEYGEVDFAFTRPENPYNFGTESIAVRAVFSVVKNGGTQLSHSISVLSGQNTEDVENDLDLLLDPSTSIKPYITVSDNQPFTYGDVNFDGAVDSADATLVLQHYANLIVLDSLALLPANVNADSNIDSADATLILQKYASLITAFPAEA